MFLASDRSTAVRVAYTDIPRYGVPLKSVRDWLLSFGRRRGTSHHEVRGIPVVVENTRAEIETTDVIRRLARALTLIDQHTPHYGRHLRRDFAGIIIKRYECRGAYFADTHTCLVELTFCVNATISQAQIAATILHEAMHARLHALGSTLEFAHRPREERFCRRAEIEFGRLVPDGEPVVRRALEALALSDEEVAPQIDERLAARRIAPADLDALQAPRWLKQTIARRRGLDA